MPTDDLPTGDIHINTGAHMTLNRRPQLTFAKRQCLLTAMTTEHCLVAIKTRVTGGDMIIAACGDNNRCRIRGRRNDIVLLSSRSRASARSLLMRRQSATCSPLWRHLAKRRVAPYSLFSANACTGDTGDII